MLNWHVLGSWKWLNSGRDSKTADSILQETVVRILNTRGHEIFLLNPMHISEKYIQRKDNGQWSATWIRKY